MTDYRLKIESMLRDAGYLEVDWDNAHSWSSVKTHTARGIADGQTFFVKIRRHNAREVEAETQSYRILGNAIPSDTGVHVPDVLVCDPEHGILVTEVAAGRLMTSCILSALGAPDAARQLEELSERAGRALAVVHRYVPGKKNGDVFLYLDFSPQNLFVGMEAVGITLIDPPERIEYGERERDLGVATVELMKQFLRSWRSVNPGLWKRCRRRFLSGYSGSSDYVVDYGRLEKYEMAHFGKLVSLNKKYLLMKYGPRNAVKALVRGSLTMVLLVGLKFFHLSRW